VALFRCVAVIWIAVVTEISGYGSCSIQIVCNVDMAITVMIMVPEFFS